MKYYAGIGSRNTPPEIQEIETKIAERLGELGWTLRSGGADGSDKAFEAGASKKEIYLPWRGFNGSDSSLFLESFEKRILDEAETIARDNHPNPNLTASVLKMMTRNTFQVLGKKLNEPSSFVICWTQDGCESAETRTNKTGGTGQAIALASKIGIPIFNLANEKSLKRLEKFWNLKT